MVAAGGLQNLPEVSQGEFGITRGIAAAQDTVQATGRREIPVYTLRDPVPVLPEPAHVSSVWTGELPGAARERTQPDTVHVWNYAERAGFDLAETDSTLRWTQLLNLFDRFGTERGAITYRMGTVGRMDGLDLHAFESRHLNLEMEGMNINDPLTGGVNWNRVATHKIGEFSQSDYGAAYHGNVRLRDHYLVQPRTYLNFDESSFDYRSLEFSYTQNFLKTTNLELSFWDRRDGIGYSRSNLEGRQATVRVYHQMTENWLLKAGLINNVIERQEPFGYQVSDPRFFTFNHFIESPVQGGAVADQSSTDIYLHMHHRRDTFENVTTKFGLHYQTDKWALTSNADTTNTAFSRLEVFGRKNVSFRSLYASATARAFFLNENEKENLSESSWIGGAGDLLISQRLSDFAELNVHARATMWDDDRLTTEASARMILTPGSRLTLSAFGGILSQAPDIQSLYWNSSLYSGNPGLPNEESVTAGATAEFGLSRILTIGLRGDIRETSHAAYLDEEGQFTSIDPYTLLSGTAWLQLDSRIFEGEVSGTFKSYDTIGLHPVNRSLANSGERIWIKSHFYWKNYLFDKATYVKAGLSGMFSPNPFRTAEFITPLNRWQHGTNEFVNPSYYRLDVDVSARIRWFMVLLKWENVLDRVEQLGYFESTGYPMPDRRFRFGIRVLFTN